MLSSQTNGQPTGRVTQGLSQRTMSCPIHIQRFTQPLAFVLRSPSGLGLPSVTPANAQAPAIENGVTVGPVTGFPLPRLFRSVPMKPMCGSARAAPMTSAGRLCVRWLPVEITAEFGNWRKIRDMEGDEGWIRHDLLTGRRTAVIAPWSDGDPVPARARPNWTPSTRICFSRASWPKLSNATAHWCEVSSAIRRSTWRGFVRQTSLWGAYPDEAFEAN
jgi:SH3-like domain-containing protein